MNNFWQDCLAQIKAMKLPPMIITNWFEPIELVRWDSERGDMVLEAPASKVQTIRATYPVSYTHLTLPTNSRV